MWILSSVRSRQVLIPKVLKLKSGETSNPINWRGYFVSTVLESLYASLINTRLGKLTEDGEIQARGHARLRKDHRCSDHLLTLCTLIEQQRAKKGGKINGCLKFLLRHTTPFLGTYYGRNSKQKLEDTRSFESERRMKQGCPLLNIKTKIINWVDVLKIDIAGVVYFCKFARE